MFNIPLRMRISFFYLNSFSAVGGIQKFNSNVIRSLSQLGIEDGYAIQLLSLHDVPSHIPPELVVKFKSAYGNKFRFLLLAIRHLFSSDQVFLGHVNLVHPLVWINHLLFKKRINLFIHGVEVWKLLNITTRKALPYCDKILSVSKFTANKTSKIQRIAIEKFDIFPNVLDADHQFGIAPVKPAFLVKKYGLNQDSLVVLTVARLSHTELNKGYDKVLEALPSILLQFPTLKYLLAGKVDNLERDRLNQLVEQLGIGESVIFTGFITEDELVAHYQLCDLFILPSSKEGFGIVFIEATACGKPVIAGNKDGAVEALLHGQIGCIINPENLEEIKQSITSYFLHQWPAALTNSERLSMLTLQHFGFDKMKENLKNVIT